MKNATKKYKILEVKEKSLYNAAENHGFSAIYGQINGQKLGERRER